MFVWLFVLYSIYCHSWEHEIAYRAVGVHHCALCHLVGQFSQLVRVCAGKAHCMNVSCLNIIMGPAMLGILCCDSTGIF